MTMARPRQKEKCCATAYLRICNCRHIQRLRNHAVEDGLGILGHLAFNQDPLTEAVARRRRFLNHALFPAWFKSR